MARRGYDYARPVRRILVALLVLVLLAVFVFWRIDSPRAERMRAAFVDRFVPSMDWAMTPVTVSGKPADRAALRAMSPVCSPASSSPSWCGRSAASCSALTPTASAASRS